MPADECGRLEGDRVLKTQRSGSCLAHHPAGAHWPRLCVLRQSSAPQEKRVMKNPPPGLPGGGFGDRSIMSFASSESIGERPLMLRKSGRPSHAQGEGLLGLDGLSDVTRLLFADGEVRLDDGQRIARGGIARGDDVVDVDAGL